MVHRFRRLDVPRRRRGDPRAAAAGRSLYIDPTIPIDWPGFELRWRRGTTTYAIAVEFPDGVSRGIRRVELDGSLLRSDQIPWLDDGRHQSVLVVLGAVDSPERDEIRP